jgi:hypothetical protein
MRIEDWIILGAEYERARMVGCTNPEHHAVLLVQALHIHTAITPLDLGRLPVNLLLELLFLVLHLEAIDPD